MRRRKMGINDISALDVEFDKNDSAERKIGTEKIWDDPMW